MDAAQEVERARDQGLLPRRTRLRVPRLRLPWMRLPPLTHSTPARWPAADGSAAGVRANLGSLPETRPADATVARLVDSHRQFLAFLERRVGSRAAAEDILQEAFVRGITRADGLRSQESAVAWFYRLLRNAITDHFRRRQVERRALERLASEPSLEPAPEPELTEAVCGCIRSLVDTLKPEYAAILKRVDLEGLTPTAFAREAGITPNNAAVRAHRARLALRRQVEKSCGTCATHGCYNCECRADHAGAAAHGR